MSDIDKVQALINQIIAFRDERDWKQFHNPKDCALSLVLEAGEVMEHFQWKGDAEMLKYVAEHRGEIGEELADVLYWVLLMGHDMNIDVLKALEEKMKKNEEKYPLHKSKGLPTKYNKL